MRCSCRAGSNAYRAGDVLCANCGTIGHMYRICNQPVSSFGVVCFRQRTPDDAPEYMMVQRKDSLSFVEFIRGKYNIQNRGYIMRLLSNMTNAERRQLAACDFDDMWHGFWQSDHNRSFMKEYEASKGRFEGLRAGYWLRPHHHINQQRQNPVFFSLDVALRETGKGYDDSEFGFPKGRRNINETDMQCAVREFVEETGVPASDLHMLPSMGTYEEVFTGSNNIRYRHVYFIASLKAGSAAWVHSGVMSVVDPVQLREVKATGWFGAEGVLARIRDGNKERKDVFAAIHARVSKRAASPSTMNPHVDAWSSPSSSLTPHRNVEDPAVMQC